MGKKRLIGRRFLLSVVVFAVFNLTNHAENIKINREDIKTVSVRNSEGFMFPAIIKLDTENTLDINFDILGDNREYLCYRLLHCNKDWRPSLLIESEFLSGFNEGRVEDYESSYNTYTHYVNYNLRIPSPDNQILKSGNYLLQIYPENEPEDVILEIPFNVSENLANISGSVTGKTDKGINDKYHQLELEIQLQDNIDPFQDIYVTVVQNNRPETKRELRHPTGKRGNKVEYKHLPELIFDGSNEYRRFETVRADYAGMGVDSVRFMDDVWHAWLTLDESRKNRNYVYDQTQHGRFKIDEYNSNDPDLSADYVEVHFQLDLPDINGRQIYVDGDFTGHNFNDFNKMIYNPDKSVFESTIKLKQGSYNYQYVIRDELTKEIKTDLTEGSNYETFNEYLIRVYLKKPGDRADRLIGYKIVGI